MFLVLCSRAGGRILSKQQRFVLESYDNPKGYTLGTGCRTLGYKPENIIALMDAARVYGKWGF